MTWWLWENYRDTWDIQVVFANTGQENEETLQFVQKCSEYFGFPVTWVEAVFHAGRKGTTHKVVNYETAHRGNDLFRSMCAKYGIPNVSTPHCTRELKERPMTSFIRREIGWKTYYTAIGIRSDEIDRINKNWKKKRFIYPLVHSNMRPMTKPKINFWWSLKPFRLNLKGFQGNCKTCWKKSDVKLYQIAIDTPEYFDDFRDLQNEFENFIPPSRLKLMEARGENPTLPVRFFRKNRSVEDIIRESEQFKGKVIDDAQIFEQQGLFEVDLVGGESCEVFAECAA